jgi:hypothetical protein
MSLKALVKPLVPASVLEWRRSRRFDMGEHAFGGPEVAEDIKNKYGFDGELLRLYSQNKGAMVHKWHHYIPLYDRYFSAWRGKPLRFLEIGVSKGGSLQLWRQYFGKQATIYGIDINPDCAEFDGQAGQVRIGSQADGDFLNKVVDEMGGVDIVVDDGSHQMVHMRESLSHLFPRLAEGGVYMIEDLHCSYLAEFGGGLRARANFFNYLSELVEDMHHWYHKRGEHHPSISRACTGIHIHDSIAVLEKAQVHMPVHSMVS